MKKVIDFMPQKAEENRKEWIRPEITNLLIKETEQLLPPEDTDGPPLS
ncbi:MAG: hypothetical protein JJU37_05115 [Balneolaceae bacterium]|nr:hypothetical protein [Balneolaceae bacterium]